MAAVRIGTARFEDEYTAAEAVQMDGELRDVEVDAWRVPEGGYIGPMYDTVVRESRIYAGVPVTLRWCFTAEEVEGREVEDYPWDNGTMEVEFDGDEVVRLYTVEQSNGNAGSVEGYDTEEEAVEAAERDWDHMSDGDKARYSDRHTGACFIVTDPEGRIVRDLAEDHRRMCDRRELASRLFGDLPEIDREIEAASSRLGQETVDTAWALNEGGWDGSETVGEILAQWPETGLDEANDLLDLLSVMHVREETEESE